MQTVFVIVNHISHSGQTSIIPIGLGLLVAIVSYPVGELRYTVRIVFTKLWSLLGGDRALLAFSIWCNAIFLRYCNDDKPSAPMPVNRFGLYWFA